MFSWTSRLVACLLPAIGAWAQEAVPSSVPAPSAQPGPHQPPAEPAPPNLTVAPPKPKLSPLAPAPDWSKLSEYNDVLSREEFDSAVKNIYTDEIGGHVPWKVETQDVLMDTTAGKKAPIKFLQAGAQRASLPRFWRSARELPTLKPGEPVLSGLRIALDPGHIGGAYAKMEERWLTMDGLPPVMEGSVVLQVANMLKPRLEALGAQVTLVRPQEAPVTTAKPDDFKTAARQVLEDAGVANPKETYEGIKDMQRVATVQYQAEKLFYRVSEIRARANRVNHEIKPDLVLCLHLNAAEWHDPEHPTPSSENHLHVMINGCYSEEELQTEDVRFDMLKRLFTRVDVEEMHLAEPIAQAMAQATGLPPFVYLTKNARRVSPDPYIYARNLLANRLYECPVIYLEPYVMNNLETYKRLLFGPFIGRTLMDGHLVSSPLEDYARGVTAGLVNYYQQARHSAE